MFKLLCFSVFNEEDNHANGSYIYAKIKRDSTIQNQLTELKGKKAQLEGENKAIPREKLIYAIDGLFDYPEIKEPHTLRPGVYVAAIFDQHKPQL